MDGLESQLAASAGNPLGTPSAANREDFSLATTLIQMLGDYGHEQYEAQNNLSALEIAILSYRFALGLTEVDDPKRANVIANLAALLQARFKYVGELEDLKEAISLEQIADVLTADESPDKPRRLSNLASSMLSRFECERTNEDLAEAIRLWTHAVQLVPDGHEDKPALLNNLGTSLRIRFEHSGDAADLDKAILLVGHAVDITPNDHPDTPRQMMSLGNSLMLRFVWFGKLDDLVRGVQLLSKSADLTPDSHPNKANRLTSAGCSLQRQFERLGNLEDLIEAIGFHSRAVELTPPHHTDKPSRLSNLANSLQSRYERTGDVAYLAQAIVYQTDAVALTPDGHTEKPGHLNNLGALLHIRFEQSRKLEDLDAAITHKANAVDLTQEKHPDRHLWLHNLSNSLRTRFDEAGNVADLEYAIGCGTQSVELLPENHTYRALRLRALGVLFDTRRRSPYALADDATHAMDAFLGAMRHPTSPPLEKLQASQLYVHILSEVSPMLPIPPPLTVNQAYEHALGLVPQCIWLGNNLRGRYTSKELRGVGAVVNNAATAAIAAGEYGRAFEWLEAGRAVVWSQVLQLRTPVDDLRRVHPELADEFHRISEVLRHAVSSTLPTSTNAQATGELSLDVDFQDAHGSAIKYDTLIAHIRALEGFEDFLRPKTLSQLADACVVGPIAAINIHESRCDALVLCRAGDVIHIPLPNFSLYDAMTLQDLLWKFLRTEDLLSRQRSNLREELEGEERGPKPRRTSKMSSDPIRRLLAMLWTNVVKPVLDVVRSMLPYSDNPLLHITWCPTGPLAFLPLHAAGIYPKDEIDPTRLETIMEVAVSSYTPTIEALLRSRRDATAGDTHPQTLIVSQPNTPGYKAIYGTAKEAKIIESRLAAYPVSQLNDTQGTVNAVLQGMATHNWVHLACHGVQNRKDSVNSAFVLYDGRLTLDMLMSKHLPNADLAVLSACQTATGDENLPEEAIHLAAGMLNIGYKSVVGTMWSIYDSSAPVVMDEFYRVMAEQVKKGGELQPAYALNEATKALRVRYGINDFVRWVPFIHFGL